MPLSAIFQLIMATSFSGGRSQSIQRTPDEKKVARSYYFTFGYTDYVLSLGHSEFGNFVDRTYPIKFELNDTTYTARSVSYIDLHIQIDSEYWIRTQKR